jgi:hypothetical protein
MNPYGRIFYNISPKTESATGMTFEWIFGGAAKFGLYERNAETQERRPRRSAGLYAQLCMNKELAQEMIEEFRVDP